MTEKCIQDESKEERPNLYWQQKWMTALPLRQRARATSQPSFFLQTWKSSAKSSPFLLIRKGTFSKSYGPRWAATESGKQQHRSAAVAAVIHNSRIVDPMTLQSLPPSHLRSPSENPLVQPITNRKSHPERRINTSKSALSCNVQTQIHQNTGRSTCSERTYSNPWTNTDLYPA